MGKIFYKVNRKIICYISESKNGFQVNIGKPSDREVLTFEYETLERAKIEAEQIIKDYKDLLNNF